MPRGRIRTRAAKKTYRWTGFNRFAFNQNATRAETVIYDPAVELARSRGGSGLICTRIRGKLNLLTTAGTAGPDGGAYIAAFGTDETKTVATGAPWDITAQDIDIAQKRMLWLTSWQMSPFGDTSPVPIEIEIDVKVKIKLYPQMALFLVTQGIGTHTVRIVGHCRTLLEQP